MSRISKADRQIQLQREEAGEHLYANRVRVYPKSVHGPVRKAKWAILIVCLGIYYLLPWLRWHRGVNQPDQAVLLSIFHERFYFFNLEFWPQDIYYLTGLLIMAAIALFLVTSVIGRVWCGYTCPQTVWTDLFMWVEYLIEGDRNERMKRDASPTSFDTVWRKTAKHAMWLGIAFWTGGAWIMYYVDAPTVTAEFWTGTASERSLLLHVPVHRYDLSSCRLGARTGVHLHVSLAALPVRDARRAEHHRHLSRLARRTAHPRQASRRHSLPATASIAAPVSPHAPPVSTSATASSSSASTAVSVSTPVTT